MRTDKLKDHLDMIVLAALEDRPSHGYAVIETIRLRSKGSFDLPEGTVYPALHRLEELNLLDSEWEISPAGRKRRVYALTKSGHKALVEHQERWVRFADAIAGVLGGPHGVTD